MELSEVIGIEKPDPDSQYRLRPCGKCRGENVAYVKTEGFSCEEWRVRCLDCGHIQDKGYPVKHDAQAAWNNEVRA